MKSIEPFLRSEIQSLKKKNIDTIMTYRYYSIGSEIVREDRNRSFDEFITTWIIWCKNGQYFARQVDCLKGNFQDPSKTISSKPFDYFFSNKSSILANRRLPKGKFYPPVPAHHSGEEIIVIIDGQLSYIDISETQRLEDVWSKYEWIKPSIELINLIQKEIK